ncbi:oxygen-dependent coproporphyrinogen oxidase [Pelagibacteraceae bacterium]|nr:oxygen-dependent coproporphyrinogen oxidase [Pelagibacteraceae bacterium]
MISDPKFNTAKEWFEKLRDNLVETIQNIDEKQFEESNWDHKGDGGGKMSKIKGNIIEKGGVNISTVAGTFNENMREAIPGAKEDPNYNATGISVVLHPVSPKIPSIHFNTRFIKTTQEWFGGGMDITPCLIFEDEEKYHRGLEILCNKYDKSYYPKFKKWCDDYFFLKHRNEPRGVGGIFFDYLQTGDWGKDFEFVQEVGDYFHKFIKNTLISLKDEEWSEEEKKKQLIKRSRYAEFNLLYDRGTKFGLETGGNVDAILMSMPPHAIWE